MTLEQIVVLDHWMIIPLFLVGSLLHFIYDLSKHDPRVAIIAAVNESYWEHIKIAVWPVFLLAVVEFVFGGWKIGSFIPAKTIALYSIPVLMIAIIYAYKFFTKKNILAIDILTFLITIAVSQVVGSLIMPRLEANIWLTAFSLLFLLILIISFLMLTKYPPKDSDFFKDPITKKYGFKGHKCDK